MKPQVHLVTAGVAATCSLAAFVLALCCLLAGTDPNTLKGMDLYTLNTTDIGSTVLDTMHLPPADPDLNVTSLFDKPSFLNKRDIPSALDKVQDKVEGKVDDAKQAAKNAKQDVTDAIDNAKDFAKNAASKIVSTFVNTTIDGLDIQNFYVAHLLTYCEVSNALFPTYLQVSKLQSHQGTYTAKGKQNVTYCSNGHPNDENTTSHANITNPLDFIEDFHLPDPIGVGMNAIKTVSKIIAAFYILAIIASFLTLISSILGLIRSFHPPRHGERKHILIPLATSASATFAFFVLVLASAVVHLMVAKICGFFNEHKDRLGVDADLGKQFDACTWAAVGLMGVAMIAAVADVAVRMREAFGGGGRKYVRGKEMEMSD